MTFTHPRKLIRHAAAAQLVDKTAAEDRVLRTRFLPCMPEITPALSVYTMDTTTVLESVETGPRILEHQVELIVEACFRVEAPADPEAPDEPAAFDQCDDLAFEVEQAISADARLGGTCNDCWLESTTIEQVDTLDASYVVGRFTFVAFYERAYPDADDLGEIDDFLTGTIDYRANAALAADQATDRVTVPGPF